jgi:hypothetical protein
MDVQTRLIFTGVAFGIMILTFYFSTQWGVMALGGKTAMSTHLQTTVDQADKVGLAIYRQLTVEKNMAPQLKSLARQYEDLATRETAGGFSGMRGEGDVVATLRSTARLFENTAGTIESVSANGDELYAEFQKLSDQGRKLMSEIQGTEITDGTKMRQLLLQFGSNLSNVNRVLVRMRGTSSREFVKTMNKNLGQLALTPQDNSTPAQKGAIERLTPAVRAAQKVVEQITSGDELGSETNQVFVMMEPSEAVWVYAGRIKSMWGAAIAIDLIPFCFAFISLLTAKQAKEDAEQEAEKSESEERKNRPQRMA